MDVSPNQIAEVRAFNRFYTRQIGLLNEGLLKSEFALSEARVLYELGSRDSLTAADLCRDLGLDPGYLSRMLKKFETRKLVSRRASDTDGRQSILTLTNQGRTAFERLNRASEAEIGVLLGRLPPPDRERLVKCMADVHRTLGADRRTGEPYILRPPEPGDYGWIVHRQTVLYHLEYGWDETYEALAAKIVGEFILNFDAAWERCWVAERDGAVVGSIFCVKASETMAKLRLLYVDPSARGLGIGSRLVDEVIRFTRARGYKTLTLWTNDVLVSARRIYEAAGFELEKEEHHHSFGKDLVGQYWNLTL